MIYAVRFSNHADKQFSKLDRKTKQIIETWIKRHLIGCTDPRSIPGGRPLVGADKGWRWRIGTYRILATIDDGKATIWVFKIGHRSSVYDG
jgi:mRNA interferase RelE/StbE